MSKSKKPLLEFPCDFPIKIMGQSGDPFEHAVVQIVRKHAPDVGENAFSFKQSSGGKYTAITVTIRATSQQQLDDLYTELSGCEHVFMAL